MKWISDNPNVYTDARRENDRLVAESAAKHQAALAAFAETPEGKRYADRWGYDSDADATDTNTETESRGWLSRLLGGAR